MMSENFSSHFLKGRKMKDTIFICLSHWIICAHSYDSQESHEKTKSEHTSQIKNLALNVKSNIASTQFRLLVYITVAVKEFEPLEGPESCEKYIQTILN
jgi:hypothetical protein